MKRLVHQRVIKAFIISIMSLVVISSCQQEPTYDSVDDYPVYEGNDLGLTYSPSKSQFKIWSPAAEEIVLHLYQDGHTNQKVGTHDMKRSQDGVWELVINEDLAGYYYTYHVLQDGKWLEEKPDLYSKAVGVNGQRTMILDMKTTDPEGWDDDERPVLNSFADIIIYEAHIRDLSIAENSGVKQKGKYLGLTEKGTKNSFGQSTGLDHIKDLGVTHIHLLPTFDHRSIDETRLDEPQYNWGYDPLNYNVPEGSFSTDPLQWGDQGS
jgi:pullulanase